MMQDMEIAAIISKIKNALINNFQIWTKENLYQIWSKDNLPPLFDSFDDNRAYAIFCTIRSGALNLSLIKSKYEINHKTGDSYNYESQYSNEKLIDDGYPQNIVASTWVSIDKGHELAPGLERATGIMKLISNYSGKVNWDEALRKWAIYIDENKNYWIDHIIAGLEYKIQKILLNAEAQKIGGKYRKKITSAVREILPKFISRKEYCSLLAWGYIVYFRLALYKGVLRINVVTYDPKSDRWTGIDDSGMKVMDGLPDNLEGYGKKKIDTFTQSQIKNNKFSDGELDQMVASNLDRWSDGLVYELFQALEKSTR